MAEILANGIRHHVQRIGPGGGVPVIFLHGLVMDNLSSWYFTAASKVASDAPVVLYDLRGHGKSERPAAGYDLDTLLADLHALIDALDADRVELVGNSFGGLLALAFAAAHPSRVARIALVDAHAPLPGWGTAMAETLALDGDAADATIAREFQSWLGRHSERKSNRLARAAHALVHQTSLIGDMRGSRGLSDDELASIACPVLAMYGRNSDVLHHGERLARLLPHCELRILEGCSHSVLWEATEAVCAALTAWSTSWRRRYLIVVPPLTGHINPTTSVAAALTRRGHRCAWVGHRTALQSRLPKTARCFFLDDHVPAEILAEKSERANRARGAARLKFLWEEFFVPLARGMVPGVERAVDDFAPHLLIVDQQAFAGAIVARRRQLPWASLATTGADLADPLAELPKVKAWRDEQMVALASEHDVDCDADGLYLSPHCVIAFTTAELLGDASLPPQVALVGPAIAARADAAEFPWDSLEPVPRILVSLGTVNRRARRPLLRRSRRRRAAVAGAIDFRRRC